MLHINLHCSIILLSNTGSLKQKALCSAQYAHYLLDLFKSAFLTNQDVLGRGSANQDSWCPWNPCGCLDPMAQDFWVAVRLHFPSELTWPDFKALWNYLYSKSEG